MRDCVFCKIVAGEIPATKEYEDDSIIAFRDLHPAVPVHLLVIPKKHIESLNTASLEDAETLGKIQLIIKSLAESMGVSDGYKVELNAGKFQEVKHMHYHLKGGMN